MELSPVIKNLIKDLKPEEVAKAYEAVIVEYEKTIKENSDQMKRMDNKVADLYEDLLDIGLNAQFAKRLADKDIRLSTTEDNPNKIVLRKGPNILCYFHIDTGLIDLHKDDDVNKVMNEMLQQIELIKSQGLSIIAGGGYVSIYEGDLLLIRRPLLTINEDQINLLDDGIEESENEEI